MKIPPAVFWRYSVKEWIAAVDGYAESQGAEDGGEPYSRDELTAMMEEFPDDRDAT